jgi:hypothetical protein
MNVRTACFGILVASGSVAGLASAPRFDAPPPVFSEACQADARLTGRSGHALVYDEQAHRVLLFVGAARADSPSDRATPYVSSLWSWDGIDWHCLANGGPPGRTDSGLAYDRGRKRVVLFGGRRRTSAGMDLLTDTWEWDGARGAQRD